MSAENPGYDREDDLEGEIDAGEATEDHVEGEASDDDLEDEGQGGEAAEVDEGDEPPGDDSPDASVEDEEPAPVEGESGVHSEASSGEDAASDEVSAAAPAEPANPNLKWYAVHTYSNFEEKAKTSLLEKVKLEGYDHFFGEVLVPIEEITEIVGGKKRTIRKRFYPGYMFVQMELTDQTWHVVNETPKVTGFVGDKEKPTPLRKREIAKLTQQVTEGTVEKKPRVVYVEGETIRVTEGSFANFDGVIEEVKEEQQKLRVLVSIFGRPTPVELAFDQVAKVLK